MKLIHLTLSNYRCFSRLSVDFGPDINVFVAANGNGKTALLDAVAVALSPYVGCFDAGNRKDFRASDARLNPIEGTDEMEACFPLTIECSGYGEDRPLQWKREHRGPKTGTTIRDAGELTTLGRRYQQAIRDRDQEMIVPMTAYYGIGRFWRQDNESTKKRRYSDSRTAAFMDCLEPAAGYVYFKKWFIKNELAEFQHLKARPTPRRTEAENPYSLRKGVIRRAVDTVLQVTGWGDIEYRGAFGEIAAHHAKLGWLPVAQLSDGIRNTLGLVADMAYRCLRLNPHLGPEAAIRTPGIVLIDEVDIHLHPAWQQQIVRDLHRAFPALQFILTTHSPQVLSSLPAESIRILDHGQAYAAPPGTQGAESARILKRVFGVDPRPPLDENTRLLKRYLDAVYADGWETPATMDWRKQLDAIYQGEEPLLTEADLYIENRRWELADEENLQNA